MDWPGRRNDKTWWRDPSKVPGGGWLDHAIYQVDQLRWILNDEVVKVTGVAKTLAHPELPKELEDFGVALLEFGGGAVATVEVTWTARSGAGLSLLQYVGTEGQIVHDQTLTGKVSVVGNFETPAGGGWTTFSAPARPVHAGAIEGGALDGRRRDGLPDAPLGDPVPELPLQSAKPLQAVEAEESHAGLLDHAGQPVAVCQRHGKRLDADDVLPAPGGVDADVDVLGGGTGGDDDVHVVARRDRTVVRGGEGDAALGGELA
jgi:predicted dehydrogenase